MALSSAVGGPGFVELGQAWGDWTHNLSPTFIRRSCQLQVSVSASSPSSLWWGSCGPGLIWKAGPRQGRGG